MKAGDTRSKRHAIAATILSVLLASCTASTDDVPFGFASVTAPGVASTDFTSAETAFPATEFASATEFVIDEGDPELPDSVTSAPTQRPGAENAVAAKAEAVTPEPEVENQPVQLAQAVVPPAAQASTDQDQPAVAQELENPQPRTAATSPAPDPEKRGFLSSFFSMKKEDTTRTSPEALVERVTTNTDPLLTAAMTAPPAGEQDSAEQDGPADATQSLEHEQPQIARTPPPAEPSKRSFLSSLFSANKAEAAPAPMHRASPSAKQAGSTVTPHPDLIDVEEPHSPLIEMASTGPLVPSSARAAVTGDDALPGVRADSLFEITRRSGRGDDSDVDIYEDAAIYQVASAAGLSRLAPNGFLKQHDDVDLSCMKPSLVRVLRTVENHFGRKAIITSGYRDPERNRRARGARNSMHMHCAAVDVQIPGVSSQELARFARAMPGRGGVGTYCHTKSVHIDVGPERDWNWRCGRR